MNAAPPFDGRDYIADKSALVRINRLPAGVRSEWERAVDLGQVRTTEIVKLEVLYSAQGQEQFEELEEELSGFTIVPTTQSVCSAAITAMRELVPKGPRYHRVDPPDALIAAAAQDAGGIGVLHYCHHYDRLTEVLNFESRWIVSPGTVP